MNNSFFFNWWCILLLFEFSHCDLFVRLFSINYLLNFERFRIWTLNNEHETCSTPERVQYWLEFKCFEIGKEFLQICIGEHKPGCFTCHHSIVIVYRPKCYYVKVLRTKKNTIHCFFMFRLLSIANLWAWNTSIG